MGSLFGRMPPVLRDAAQACRRHLVLAALFSALVNLLYLAPTLYMMQVYDRVLGSGSLFTLLMVTAIVLAALATLAALDHVRIQVLAKMGLRLERQLAGPILSAILGRGAMARGGRGRLGQVLRDFDLFRQGATGPAALALLDAPWTPIYLAIAFMVHPYLGLLALAGSLMLLGLAVANEAAVRGQLKRANAGIAAAYAASEEASVSNDIIVALGMRQALRARHLDERWTANALSAEAGAAGARYSSLIKFLRLSLQSLALGLGAWLAIHRQISAGSIIAASVLLSRALQPIEQVVGAWRILLSAKTALEGMVALFQANPREAEHTRLPDPKGDLAAEHVTVWTSGRERALLHDVSFSLTAGEVLGVIGPSGAGKTTLARVLAGALLPDNGQVRFDLANALDWDSDLLAEHVGYLPQDSRLLAGSIRDNISRFQRFAGADPQALDAKVVAAAQQAGAHALILRLEHGYDTRLGTGGGGLSAGQMQRIALARALYGDPSVLILDEPNSHLDAEGEAALVGALAHAKARGASAVVIAHRTGIISQADKLLLLRNGCAELFGPRQEVLDRLANPTGQLPAANPAPGPEPEPIAERQPSANTQASRGPQTPPSAQSAA